MERDYGQLMSLALELGEYQGYLDTRGEKEKNALQARYRSALRAFAYDVLKDEASVTEAAGLVNRDINEIAALSDEGFHPVYGEVREDILAQIERDASKKPWQRTFLRRWPIIVGVVIASAYLGVRLFSATPVVDPLDTREGLIERAYALDKALRYDDWASTQTRGGAIFKPVLLWPIQPTETEINGATELARLIFGGADELQSLGQVCNIPPPTSETAIGQEEIALLQMVTSHLRGSETQWRDPPIMTVLDPIKSAFPC